MFPVQPMTCLRRLLALLALGLAMPNVAVAAPVDLPARVSQGGLVIGHVPPGTKVAYDGKVLRVGADGNFLFGVGRDARGRLELVLTHADGRRQTHHVTVVARDWPVERVNGVPAKTVNPPPAIAARIAREQAAVAAARRRDDNREDFLGGFIWPVHGRISGRFGNQRIYNGTPKSPHSGMDIAVPTGTPIKAPAAGIITLAEPDLYLTGGTVMLDHGFGLSSVFLHMSRIDVKVGQRLQQGQVIGAAGMSGRATGPHVHWGMNWFGVRIDPLLLVPPAP